jgi:methionyl-tRNA formyltransferase
VSGMSGTDDSDLWFQDFDASGNSLSGPQARDAQEGTEGLRHPGGSGMRVVFMGTPAFALGSLRALVETDGIDVVAAVTRPDAVSGRGKTPSPSPVKEFALQAGIPVIETKTLRDPDIQQRLRDLEPDVIAVTAYGALIPDEVLRIPSLGCVNVHASLLPRWRGAAPIQRAILAGDPIVGFSIMKVGHELDAGPWCVQSGFAPGEHTFDEVADRLSKMGGQALAEVLVKWWQGTPPEWEVQDPDRATYAEKISKQEMLLDPNASAIDNVRRVCASSDAAPARCTIAGRGVRVVRAHIPAAGEQAPQLRAGEVAIVDRSLYLGCSDGTFLVLEVRPDGKRQMDSSDFVAGMHQRENLSWEALA